MTLLPKRSVGAEIGVWKGEFSERILERLSPEKLFLVDPWAFQPEYPERRYGGRDTFTQDDMDALYCSVAERFARNENVVVTRTTSEAFLSGVGAEALDWVYIDGNHSESFVYTDLSLSWPSIRSGGAIAGDDYSWQDVDGSLPVKAAVDRFCKEAGLKPKLVRSQFLIEKP